MNADRVAGRVSRVHRPSVGWHHQQSSGTAAGAKLRRLDVDTPRSSITISLLLFRNHRSLPVPIRGYHPSLLYLTWLRADNNIALSIFVLSAGEI